MWSNQPLASRAAAGAGTPNQAGVGGFLPLSVGYNSVWYLDAWSTPTSGTERATAVSSTPMLLVASPVYIGYRWLNSNRSWMYGLNAGYDSRSLKSGNTDTGVSVTNKKTVGFQQIALNAEAVSDSWTFNSYGLIAVGDVEQKLNSHYDAGALNTYGLDVGYFISPALHASIGYYYQHRDQEDVDGSGVRGRLAYDITQDLTAGINISYDEAFDTCVSADLKVRFGVASTTAKPKAIQQLPVINAITSVPSNRDIRVHDLPWWEWLACVAADSEEVCLLEAA